MATNADQKFISFRFLIIFRNSVKNYGRKIHLVVPDIYYIKAQLRKTIRINRSRNYQVLISNLKNAGPQNGLISH